MTDKDPKNMTAAELLREADSNPCSMCHLVMTEDVSCATTGCASWAYRLADKIDAELAQARGEALRQGAELWAKANGWPDFREGEDFGQWLERCALKLPCDKDGEPWSIGDRVMPGNRSESTVTGYDFDGNEWFLKYRWCGIDSYANEFATSCKRPAPEALGADGLPIVAGETVHPIYGAWFGIPLEVIGIEQPASVKVSLPSGKGWTHFQADCLTHTPPDTQRKINADVTKNVFEYWGCGAVLCDNCPVLVDGKRPREWLGAETCHDAKVIDLLRRQRELDAKGGAK